jgi:hypothetical protein
MNDVSMRVSSSFFAKIIYCSLEQNRLIFNSIMQNLSGFHIHKNSGSQRNKYFNFSIAFLSIFYLYFINFLYILFYIYFSNLNVAVLYVRWTKFTLKLLIMHNYIIPMNYCDKICKRITVKLGYNELSGTMRICSL